MRKTWIMAAGLSLVLLTAGAALAAGPHDMDCMQCHSTHYAKADYIIGVDPVAPENPARTRTKATAEDIDALCLGCHNEQQGITPVKLHTTHPTGVTPTYTPVPQKLMWDGKFTCVSCHNPHPSNANYKYLVADTKGGKSMGLFCAQCHPGQSDPSMVSAAQSATLTLDPPSAPIIKIVPQAAKKK